MKTPNATPRITLIFFAVLLATSAAQAGVVIVPGNTITLMSGTGNLTVFDPTNNGSSVIKTQNNSPGSMGQFDPSLGVLTGAVGTLTLAAPTTLSRIGSPGSAGFSYQWLLGGDGASKSTSTANSLSLNTAVFGSLSVTSSSSDKLNNFVGLGNIGQNVTNTQLSANRSGVTLSGTSGSVSPNPVLATESIAYTYSTHSNASFDSTGDANGWTLNFGLLASGAVDDQTFSIFNLGGLGLTNFTLSFQSGDNLFNVTGGNVAAGESSLYTAHFNGQSPLALTAYDATYRLTFTDNVSSLGKYAENSVGTNSIDIRMLASVAPAVPEPRTWALMLAGLGAVGFMARRRAPKSR